MAFVPDNKNKNGITPPATKIPVVAEADVVVIGGGPGGFGAALRAARGGANTILIEKYDMPGGVHTSGLQGAAGAGVGGIHSELMERFAEEGYIHTATHEMYPYFNGNPVSHYGASCPLGSPFERKTFNPEGGGCVMLKMLEEARVMSMYDTRFVDAAVTRRGGEDTITGVIVENASGRQAIMGKVFIDGTGKAEVVARAGAPFVRGGGRQPSTVVWDGVNRPVPGGLLWTMAGIDYLASVDYQRSTDDWAFANLIAAAKAAGDIPDSLYRPRLSGTNAYGDLYIGKPTLDINPIGGAGSFLFWQNVPYEWGLHLDDSAEDCTRAKIAMREFINEEARFLNKYVPGFENAYITNIARYLGIRDGRHPIGEYVLSVDDAINSRTFADNTITRTSHFHWGGAGNRTYQVPYRCFLPKKINNLLLTGASMSFTYEVIFMAMRNFPWCVQSGEIAGYSAAWAVNERITPKEIKWTTPYF